MKTPIILFINLIIILFISLATPAAITGLDRTSSTASSLASLKFVELSEKVINIVKKIKDKDIANAFTELYQLYNTLHKQIYHEQAYDDKEILILCCTFPAIFIVIVVIYIINKTACCCKKNQENQENMEMK